jgi:hypothetical protein
VTKTRCCLVVFALGAVLAISGEAASAGTTQSGGPVAAQVRMRHLAVDVPPVDVYMAGLDGQWHVMLKGLGYGQTSPYVDVAPAVYSVALRPAGAPAQSTPAVKGTVEVSENRAYTFEASGTLANLRQRLIVDGPVGVAPSASIPAVGGDVSATPSARGSSATPQSPSAATPAPTDPSTLPATGTSLELVAIAGLASLVVGTLLFLTFGGHGAHSAGYRRRRLRT